MAKTPFSLKKRITVVFLLCVFSRKVNLKELSSISSLERTSFFWVLCIYRGFEQEEAISLAICIFFLTPFN